MARTTTAPLPWDDFAVTDHQVDLLAAWSTFGAAVLAAAASFFAFRAYVKESGIEKKLRDADERAQASLVAAWIGADPERDPRARQGGNWVVIRNASETPIYNVTWWIQLSSENVAGEPEKVVPPNTVGEIYQPPMYINNRYGLEDSDLPDLAVGLEFTGSSGVRWHRDTDGQLHQNGQGETLLFPDQMRIEIRNDGEEAVGDVR